MNLSLWDKQGRNCFASTNPKERNTSNKASNKVRNKKDASPLPAPLSYAIAGLLRYNNSAMLYYAPHLNAYRRYRPQQFAPDALFWNHDDRNATIRIPRVEPGDGGAEVRLEHRVASADANPYLVLAAILTAIRLGLEEKRLAPPAGRVVGQIPRSFHRAWQEAGGAGSAHSKRFVRAFGAEYHGLYVALKEAEYDRVLGAVGEREFSYYL